jgi:hypothetical protein
VDWSHVDLKLGAVELAADEEGRKPGGSWRVVPPVKPLHARLREAWIAQGRPTKSKVCPPRQHSPSGMLALGDVQERVHREWQTLGLKPDRRARGEAHRGDVAGPCRRLADGLDADGPQDPGVPARRRRPRSGATPTRSRTSSSVRATSSTASWRSAQRREATG